MTASNSAGSASASSAPTAVVQAVVETPPANVSLPVVGGAASATVGQQLTASPGVWDGSPAPSFGYAWLRCDGGGGGCQPVGATSAGYTPVSADAGSTLVVSVTASNSAGSASASSAPTAVVQASVGPVTGVLDDFGRADGGVGSSWSVIKSSGFAAMKIVAGVAVDSSSSQYAWNFWNPAGFGPDCEAFVTVASSSGSDTVRVGARVSGGGTGAYSGYFVSVSAAGVWSIVRVDSGSAVTLVSGVTQALAAGDRLAIRVVGSTVSALHWQPGGGWVQLLGYDTASDAVRYTQAGDLAVEFKTSTIDDFGGGTYPAAPANVSLPVVGGAASATVGQQLTASPGVWDGSPAPSFGYAWLRCDGGGGGCQPVGATSAGYTPVSADAGSTLVVSVTASNSAGSASASSAPTAVVQAVVETPPANVSLPVVGGAASATVGQQLTASPGVWDGSPAPSFGYAWLRCDGGGGGCQPVGATSAGYTPVSADAGSTLVVSVTASNSAGSASASSAPTAVVQASVGPVTGVLDDFGRADGGVGSSWSVIKSSGFAAMKIVAGVAVDSSSSQYAWNFWNPAGFGPDCEAFVTVASSSGSDTVRVGARVSGGGTGAYSGYFVSVSAAGVWSIVRVDSGSAVTLVSGVTQALAAGDRLAIRVVGSTVSALHWQPGGGWVQLLGYDTASDAVRYTQAGDLAVEFKTSTIDDFGGGTLS